MLPEARQLATVVVCEDDEATLELLCDHLRADRYEALPAPAASDGASPLSLQAARAYGVIVFGLSKRFPAQDRPQVLVVADQRLLAHDDLDHVPLVNVN